MESANATKNSRIATQKLGELMSSVKNELTKGSSVTSNSKVIWTKFQMNMLNSLNLKWIK